MKLGTYLSRRGVTQSDFAEALGCSQSYVSRWVKGEIIPVEWAIKIEQVTLHAVRVEETRPDIAWHVIRTHRRRRAA